MNSQDLFSNIIKIVDQCIRQVSNDQLTNKTPCKDWDLRELLRHIVYELLWVSELINGKTVEEVGDRFDGDILGSDIQGAWERASHLALSSVQTAQLDSIVHLSYADVSAEKYIREIAGDVLIHGWDVDQSIMCNMLIPDDIAQAVYNDIFPRKQEFADSGLFGTEIIVDSDSSIQSKLLGLVGRKVTYKINDD